jgi:hypothetical protein
MSTTFTTRNARRFNQKSSLKDTPKSREYAMKKVTPSLILE